MCFLAPTFCKLFLSSLSMETQKKPRKPRKSSKSKKAEKPSKQEKRECLRNVILPVATKAFYKEGIRAVKMDDIAAMLKMSKRTLYETYENKMELLRDVVEESMMRKHRLMEEYAKDCDNIMDLLIEFFRLQMEDYAKISPKFFSDFRRYPELLEEVHRVHASQDSSEFLKRGVEQGYFRTDVNYDFLSMLGTDFGEILRVSPKYQAFRFDEIFNSFICALLRGICTDEGLAKFNSAMDTLKK